MDLLTPSEKQSEKARRKRRDFRLNGRMREWCVELPQHAAAYRSNRTSREIVGWVEAHSADITAERRRVANAQPVAPDSRRSKRPGISD